MGETRSGKPYFGVDIYSSPETDKQRDTTRHIIGGLSMPIDLYDELQAIGRKTPCNHQ